MTVFLLSSSVKGLSVFYRLRFIFNQVLDRAYYYKTVVGLNPRTRRLDPHSPLPVQLHWEKNFSLLSWAELGHVWLR